MPRGDERPRRTSWLSLPFPGLIKLGPNPLYHLLTGRSTTTAKKAMVMNSRTAILKNVRNCRKASALDKRSSTLNRCVGVPQTHRDQPTPGSAPPSPCRASVSIQRRCLAARASQSWGRGVAFEQRIVTAIACGVPAFPILSAHAATASQRIAGIWTHAKGDKGRDAEHQRQHQLDLEVLFVLPSRRDVVLPVALVGDGGRGRLHGAACLVCRAAATGRGWGTARSWRVVCGREAQAPDGRRVSGVAPVRAIPA